MLEMYLLFLGQCLKDAIKLWMLYQNYQNNLKLEPYQFHGRSNTLSYQFT
jgi:hypothetical protein